MNIKVGQRWRSDYLDFDHDNDFIIEIIEINNSGYLIICKVVQIINSDFYYLNQKLEFFYERFEGHNKWGTNFSLLTGQENEKTK